MMGSTGRCVLMDATGCTLIGQTRRVEEDSAQDKGGLGSYVRGDQNENGRPLMTTSTQVIRYGKVVKYLED